MQCPVSCRHHAELDVPADPAYQKCQMTAPAAAAFEIPTHDCHDISQHERYRYGIPPRSLGGATFQTLSASYSQISRHVKPEHSTNTLHVAKNIVASKTLADARAERQDHSQTPTRGLRYRSCDQNTPNKRRPTENS